MPTVHTDPSLETAREQLSFSRAELILGARRLRTDAAPDVAIVHLMCDALLEYFSAAALYEKQAMVERVAELAEHARCVAVLEEQANPDAFLR